MERDMKLNQPVDDIHHGVTSPSCGEDMRLGEELSESLNGFMLELFARADEDGCIS